MKKLFLLIALAAVFAGCSKNNGNTKTSTSTLIAAKWYYTLDTTKTYSNGVQQQVSVKQYARTDYVTFNADGTGSQTLAATGSQLNFTYTISGKVVTLNFPSQQVLGGTTQAYTQTATIRQLTTTQLELYFDNSTVTSGVTIQKTEAAYFGK